MNRSFLRAAAVIAVSAGLAVSGITAASAKGKGGSEFARGLPHGFSQGEKIGWRGNTVPPGWSHGRKTGWHGAGVPPGARF